MVEKIIDGDDKLKNIAGQVLEYNPTILFCFHLTKRIGRVRCPMRTISLTPLRLSNFTTKTKKNKQD